MSTRQNASSSSSSVVTSQSNAQEDLTWLDFLRSAGGTVPLDRSSSADRKRRHTGTEPERRNYIYPQPNYTSRRHATGQAGSSRETAIDLSSPPRLPQPNLSRAAQGRQHNSNNDTAARQDTDVPLPTWQPDHTVLACPVCSTEFSFLFRRHHCRKCGRVVCANCSPHRITIPRQYIVQPAHAPYGDVFYSGETGEALGGGEVVRVCNPCVPDPWTPTATAAPSAPSPPPRTTSRAIATGPDSTDPRLYQNRDPRLREVTDRERPERYRYVSEHTMGRARSHTQQPLPSSSLPQVHSGTAPTHVNFGRHRPLPPPPQHAHRYSHSGVGNFVPSSRSHPPLVPTTTPSALPQPRREVREEDECPVCGTELPSGEGVREMHIQGCIAARFSSTPSQPPPPVPPAAAITSSSIPSGSTPPIAAASRPRATSYRPRGMALYRATEKDCLNEDGEPQECVICFEEFQPGDEMGRMECLCKFHRLCIRQWWDTKGTRSCPTHQLHD